MSDDRTASIRRTALAVVAALALASCAADREHSQGMDLVSQGQSLKGLESLKRAVELEPRNPRFQVDYANKQQDTIRDLLTQADTQADNQAWDEAARLYKNVLRLEAHNGQALRGVKLVEAERRALPQLSSADRLMQTGKTDQALELAHQVLRELPQNAHAEQIRRAAEDKLESERQNREDQLAAKAAFRRPVSLTFRDTPLKMIFEALSRAANINVVVDRDVKSDVKTTIFVKDAPIEDAIDVLLLQNQLDKRVLNGNTILVFPATAAKQKEFAELKVRSFQLSNIDAALMANILKTMIKTKDIVTDPKSNALVMRDTAEAIALAERLVMANDVPDPEVMLEVNVLEVSATRADELGLKLPTSATLSTPTIGADGKSWTASDLRALTRGQLLVTPLSATLNLMLQDSDTQLLASPRLRARNKEKARILVGDKLPQITNVLSATGTTGQNTNGYSALTGNIQYIDVGIKLEMEPEVYTDDDVGIKLNLEVSSVTDTITTQSGTAYQIGTRSAQTALRLHDGETQILGGLIRDSDSDSAQKVPGFGQLPVLGRLFSDHKVDGRKTEIVVTITPHIVRPRAAPDLRYADAWSGSDSVIRDRPLRLDSIGALKLGPVRGDAGAQPAAARVPALEGPGGRPAVPGAPRGTPNDALAAPGMLPRTLPQGVPYVPPPAPEPVHSDEPAAPPAEAKP